LLEKVEHSIVDTLSAAKDLIADTIGAVKDTVVDTIVAPLKGETSLETGEFKEGQEPDLRTAEEKFKAQLHQVRAPFIVTYFERSRQMNEEVPICCERARALLAYKDRGCLKALKSEINSGEIIVVLADIKSSI
jgi:hypothetical protein